LEELESNVRTLWSRGEGVEIVRVVVCMVVVMIMERMSMSRVEATWIIFRVWMFDHFDKSTIAARAVGVWHHKRAHFSIALVAVPH
jgi:hypothetical protein